MKKCTKITLLVLGGILLAGAVALLLGFFVMILWNWLMPDIFGLGQITFWQAWGLVFLTKLLFHAHGPHSSSHCKDSKFRTKIKKWVNCQTEQEGQ